MVPGRDASNGSFNPVWVGVGGVEINEQSIEESRRINWTFL